MKLFAELQNKEDPLNMEFKRTKLNPPLLYCPPCVLCVVMMLGSKFSTPLMFSGHILWLSC